jgi:hypothetical protein
MAGPLTCSVRSDNEPAIIKLVNTAVNLLKLNGLDITVEGSIEYDPQSNGAAESAVRLIKGQVRALQVGFENDIKSHIPVGHPVISWLVRHAAMVRTMRVVGADGKTGWQRARGAACKLKLVHFGEVARYKCRSQENGIGHSGFSWGIGIWLGVDLRTGQHILFDPTQGGIRHARTLMRMPDVQKFDRDRVAAISSTPWSIHTAANPDGVFVEKAVNEDTIADIAKVRKIYIRQADLDAFGYTPGCKKCQSILGRGKGETSAPHSDICRAGITAEISKTSEGEARLARITERADRFIAERIQEADQHAPQGGIAGNAEHVVPLPEFLPFDPVEVAARASSSTANVAPSSSSPPADRSDMPIDQNTDHDHEIVNDAPSMDLDLVSSIAKCHGGA